MLRSICEKLWGDPKKNSRRKARRGSTGRRLIFESLEGRKLLAAVINDGSFEAPGLAGGSYAYAPDGSPWQFGPGTGVSSNASVFTAANPNAPDGTQVAFIQRGGAMSQPVYMDAGTYNISMMAAQRANQGHFQQIEVLIDGACVGTITPTAIVYGPYQTQTFTVKAGTHTVKFVGLNPQGGANTAFIDEVTISALTGLSDGSFEAPGVPLSSYRYTPDGSPWQFGANTGVSSNNSAFTSGNPNAPDGGQVAFIQRGGTMSQSVYLAAGTYDISMQAAQRANPTNSQEIEVLVDGASVGTITPGSVAYEPYLTSNFTVAAGMHTLRFTGVNPKGGANTAFIDEVAISSAIVSVDGVSDGLGDGSFETPVLTAGTFQNSPDGSPWQFGQGTGVSSNNSAFTSDNPDAPDGNQVAFIQRGGVMSQSVYLYAGTYNISMMAAQRADQTNYQQIEVLVDSTCVGTITPACTDYGPYQTSNFTVTSGTHVIRFVGLNPKGGGNTALLDLVGVSQITSLSDGSFEAPGLAGGTFKNTPDGSPWQFGPGTGVSSNYSAFTGANPRAPDGGQVAFIQRGGSLSQSVYLGAGTYNISLMAAQRANQSGKQQIEVLVDGASVGTLTPDAIVYGPYETLNFTVAAGLHTIRFLGLNPQGGANTAFIDEVAISAVTSVSDGSFESPGLAASTYAYQPDGSPWQFGPDTGVSSNGSDFTSNNSTAPDGSQVAFIQDGGAMSQSLYLSAGAYTLSLMAAQRAGQSNNQEIQVWIDNVAVGTITPNSTSYSSYETPEFTVAAGPHTVRFVGLNPESGNNTVFIDLVAITAAT
jgi:acetolactate synthase regulatory subunit